MQMCGATTSNCVVVHGRGSLVENMPIGLVEVSVVFLYFLLFLIIFADEVEGLSVVCWGRRRGVEPKPGLLGWSTQGAPPCL